MSEIKVRLGQPAAGTKVRVGEQPAVKVISSFAGARELANLNDVDVTNISNGSVLVYNAITEKWESTLTLTPGTTQNLDINGGNF